MSKKIRTDDTLQSKNILLKSVFKIVQLRFYRLTMSEQVVQTVIYWPDFHQACPLKIKLPFE